MNHPNNPDHYRWLTLALVGIWFLASLVTLNSNGLFFDEGIYITAGLRTLQGHGYSDQYLTWFGGTLLWPALAGIGYRLAGTVGARALALLAVSAGLLAFSRARRATSSANEPDSGPPSPWP